MIQVLIFYSNIQIIETDAPIDKGNSGGGLFDIDGKLIGIASRCNITGGPKSCRDKDGMLTLTPQNPYEQCEFYCNKTQPQNWFIPISRYPELKNDSSVDVIELITVFFHILWY